MVLALDVVVMAVDRFARYAERGQVPPHRPQHEIHHRMAVCRRVILRPTHRLDVVLEVPGSLLEIGEIAVREPGLATLGIAPRELDEIRADGIADAAAARVQHRPHLPGLVEAYLDEMIAPAQRAHLVHPVLRARKALLDRTVLVQDALEAALEGLCFAGERASFLVLVAPDRDVARDLVEHALET